MSSVEFERRGIRIWPVIVVGLAGVVLGMRLAAFAPDIGLKGSAAKSSQAKTRDESTVAAPPMLIRQGDAVFIPEGSPYRSRIAVAPVETKTLRPARALPAAVEADMTKTVNVLPPVAGRVIELKVRLGDEVKQGEVLVVVDSGDLAQAYADVDKGQAELKLTSRALERARGLKTIGGGAQKDLEQAESDFAKAQAEFNRAQSRLQAIVSGLAEDQQGARTLRIVAPTNGTITSISTAPGAFLNDPTVAIMTITNLDTVWVTANVPENDLSFIAKNQDVEVTLPAYPDTVFHGKVGIVSQVLEPDTRRAKVRIVFSNPGGKLKPNMFATVTFLAPARREPIAPTSALLMNNDTTTVFIETKPWTFIRRIVEPEADQNGIAPIRAGLAAGEKIVVSGGVLLND